MHLFLALLLSLACSDKDDADDDGGGGDGGAGVDADNDGFEAMPEGDDCDDSDPAVNPFAEESCNGQDEDCDGVIDEDSAVDAVAWFPDEDGDGYGDEERSDRACDPPEEGWILQGGDCDDGEAEVHPGVEEICDAVDQDCDKAIDDDAADAVSWYRDVDEDGYGGDSEVIACNAPDDGAVWQLDGGDCDDTDDARSPGIDEVCDGLDNDCDELTDDADPDVDESTWAVYFRDHDGDGFGDPTDQELVCGPPAGFVDDDSDCDDDEAEVHPGATEICDTTGTDEDCDSLVNDADDSVASGSLGTWYLDADQDGYGSDTATAVFACEDPSAGATTYALGDDSDCDDLNRAIHPGASEVCDDADTDEDCSGTADDADASTLSSSKSTWYLDADRDGYGAGESATTQCEDPSTSGRPYVANASDCNDDDEAIHPAADEVCDAGDVDEDCSGAADDEDPDTLTSSMSTWYADRDGDGYGDPAAPRVQCEEPGTGWSDLATDCNDEAGGVHPGAAEVCDDIDNDCDAATTTDNYARLTSTAGAVTDLSSSFAAGTASRPARITLGTAGELELCDGTYYANLTVTADLEIIGLFDPVIDGGGSRTVVALSGAGTDLVLRGLEITNGNADHTYGSVSTTAGGGVWCNTSSSVTLDDVFLHDNYAEVGGGLYIDDCDLTVTNSVIADNISDSWSAGLYQWGGTATITNSTLSGNSSQYGAVTVRDTTLTLEDTVVSDNSGNYGIGYLFGGHLLCSRSDGAEGGFFRNDSSSTAGLYVYYYSATSAVTSDGCDWGTGFDDNDPHDIVGGRSTLYDYGNDATFTCDNEYCY